MSFVENVSKEGSDRIYLIRGVDSTNRQAWYYVRIASNKLRLFEFHERKMVDRSSLNLNDFGEILHSGYGKSPPKHIEDLMFRDFGFRSFDE